MAQGFEDYILRPSGIGGLTQIGAQFPDAGFHWQKVDEVVTDDSDYVYVTPVGPPIHRLDLYAIPDETYSGVISSVTVNYRVKRSTGEGGSSKASIRTHNTNYYGTERESGTKWRNESTEWITNPNTGNAWTWKEIRDLQIGISLKLSTVPDSDVYCSQVYVEIKSK